MALKTKNVPGALGDIASRLGTAKINIHSISNYSLPDNPESMITLFAAANSKSVTEQELRNVVTASPYVTDNHIKKSETNFLVNDFAFPLMYFPSGRGILLPQSGISAMFQEIVRLFGTGGEAILYQAGYSVGRQGTDEIEKIFTPEQMLNSPAEFTALYAGLGWGKLQVVDAGPNLSDFLLRLEDGFESDGVRSRKPNCHFSRGLITSSSERITGLKLQCVEEKCASTGDPYCQFRVSAR